MYFCTEMLLPHSGTMQQVHDVITHGAANLIGWSA
jgi:hypothetical protein